VVRRRKVARDDRPSVSDHDLDSCGVAGLGCFASLPRGPRTPQAMPPVRPKA
jgi:hypothetical protein